MLTPKQIDALRDRAEEVARPITEYLLQDIARRVSEAGQLTSTAAYQVWRAQNLGLSQKEIKAKLKKLLNASESEINSLLTQSAEVGYNFDLSNLPTDAAIPFSENDIMQQLVSAAVKLAQDDFTNLTQSIGMVDPFGNALPLQDAYRKCCDFAFEQVFTGAADYNTAIRRATKNLADMGVRVIDYESGVHTSIEAATRRNIMGGLGLLQEQISQQNHDSFGADGWEISAHAACAPDHEPIQGKQYTDAEYQALNNSLVRRIGTLNCGHAAFPIVLGISEPQYTGAQLQKFRDDNASGVDYQGRHYSMYEATQKQRQVERCIRKQKNRILVDDAVGDTEKLQIDQIRLRRLNEEYSRFSKASRLPTQRERAQVAGVKQTKTADKTMLSQIVANEQSPRPRKTSSYAVDWEAVQKPAYAAKFDKLSTSSEANRAVHTRARWALNNRDGSKTEEIYAVDMRNGSEIARITDQHYAQGVRRTSQFDINLRTAAESGADIMLIHNHPAGMPPSVSDINLLLGTKLRGITVGHNGSVYYYTAPKKIIPREDFEVAIRKHKEYTVITGYEKALQDLAKIYGFTFTKL